MRGTPHRDLLQDQAVSDKCEAAAESAVTLRLTP